MGLANEIARVLKEQLQCHVAWVPISNTFTLGDYGVFSHGVFTKLGRIDEFGVSFDEKMAAPARIDFVSDDTKVTNLVGDVEVDVLPELAVNAKVKIAFKNEHAFVLRAKSVSVHEAQNVAQVMRRLEQHEYWRRSYKVVAKLWEAQRAVLLSTIAADTTVTVGGSVPALKEFNVGDLSATLRVSQTRELGLQILGASGAIGLGLVQNELFGGVGFLGGTGRGPGTGFEHVAPGDSLPEDDL
jgi:hypothetical protein